MNNQIIAKILRIVLRQQANVIIKDIYAFWGENLSIVCEWHCLTGKDVADYLANYMKFVSGTA